MTTTRAFVDSPLRCRYDGKRMVIETDGDGNEVHECLECDRRTVIDRDGFGSELAALPWQVERCKRCQGPVIWATTLRNGKRVPVDAAPSPAGRIQLQTGPRGTEASFRTVRRANLRTVHPMNCTQAVSS